jgi:hypothetical protein
MRMSVGLLLPAKVLLSFLKTRKIKALLRTAGNACMENVGLISKFSEGAKASGNPLQ